MYTEWKNGYFPPDIIITSPQDGGFYSAEDADSFPTDGAGHKREGAFCVWTQEEVDKILCDPLPSDPSKTLAELFSYHYGVEPHGNVAAHQVRAPVPASS